LVRCRTNSHFDSFEIKSATLAQSSEDHFQEELSSREISSWIASAVFFSLQPTASAESAASGRSVLQLPATPGSVAENVVFLHLALGFMKAASVEKVSVIVLPSLDELIGNDYRDSLVQ